MIQLLYYLRFLLVISFTIFGIIVVFRNKRSLSRNVNILIGLFILLTYMLTFAEAYSNSNIEATQTKMLLPHFNVSNLIVLVTGLCVFLPNDSKIKKSILTIAFYISFSLIMNMIDVLLYYSQFSYSYERYFWILFMNAVTFLYLTHCYAI